MWQRYLITWPPFFLDSTNMIALILYLTGLLTAIGCGLLASYHDWRDLKIPNIYPAIVLGGFALAYLADRILGPQAVFQEAGQHALSGLIVFSVTLIMVFTIQFGAGDSKLLTAYAFWFPLNMLLPFVFFVSVVGALLALSAIVMRKIKPFGENHKSGWLYKLQMGENAVPYGIAIVIGAIVAFLSQEYLSGTTLGCFLQTACS